MNYPLVPAAGTSVAKAGDADNRNLLLRPSAILTRRYDIACITEQGRITQTTEIAPAMPAFEEAFSAFARGTLIGTPEGPVAVEDLTPGQKVLTSDGPRPMRWRGSITLFPTREADAAAPLTRLPAHAFGPERPSENLVLGPAARFAERASTFSDQPLAAPQECVDGETALAIRPLVPVSVFHLVLDRQNLILANGIETASYHPSMSAQTVLRGDLSKLFMALFPHLTRISDFGPPLAIGPGMRSVA